MPISSTIEPSSIQIETSTSQPSIQPAITTIPTEPIPSTSPTTNPTESPTQILYYPDWSNQLCSSDPKDRPVGYALVQGRQPLFQTLEACCNSQFWWDVDGCLLKSNGSAATIVEQTDLSGRRRVELCLRTPPGGRQASQVGSPHFTPNGVDRITSIFLCSIGDGPGRRSAVR